MCQIEKDVFGDAGDNEDGTNCCFEKHGIEGILETLIDRHNKYEQRTELSIEIVEMAEFVLQEYVNTVESTAL